MSCRNRWSSTDFSACMTRFCTLCREIITAKSLIGSPVWWYASFQSAIALNFDSRSPMPE